MYKFLFTLIVLQCSHHLLRAQNVGINNTNPQAALDIQGDLRLRSAILTLPANINNDVDLTTVKSSVYMFGGGALTGCQVTGFTGGVDGRIVTIFNNSTTNVVQLYDANFSISPSAAANKIVTGNGNNAIIYGNGSVTMRYDGAKQKWTIIASNFVDGLDASPSWRLTGNAGITANNFIGTTDAVPLKFRINNANAGILDSLTSNTALGYRTLDSTSNTPSQFNTAIGYKTMISNKTGLRNTAIGGNAFRYNTTGNNNTALGYFTLYSNTDGHSNTGLGYFALASNTTGNGNSAIGRVALISNTEGFNNVANGIQSMEFNTTGANNVGIGSFSLLANTEGHLNSALGASADVLQNNLINATAIGSYAKVGCTNCIVLGTNAPVVGSNPALDKVKVGIGTSLPIADLHIKQVTENFASPAGVTFNNNGGIRIERVTTNDAWNILTDNANDFDFNFNGKTKSFISSGSGNYFTASDIRVKKNIQLLTTILPTLMQLQPKTYLYNDNNADAPLSYGFIAQEVEKLFPAFVTTKGKEGMKAIAYQNFSVIAIKAIQEQQAQIQNQQQQIEELKKMVEALMKK